MRTKDSNCATIQSINPLYTDTYWLTFTIILTFTASAWRITSFFKNRFFYAEDGMAFFIQAIELDFRSLITPYSHYLFIGRLLTFFAVKLSIFNSPLIIQILGGIITSISLSVFSTSHYSWIVPNRIYRILTCLLFSLTFGIDSIYFTVCNLYYPLGFLILLLLIGKKDNWYFSKSLLVITAFLFFSCGFSIIFFPLIALMFFLSKNKNYLVLGGILLLCSLLNFLSLSDISVKGDSLPTVKNLLVFSDFFSVILKTIILNYLALPILGERLSLSLEFYYRIFIYPILILFLIVFFLARRKITPLAKNQEFLVICTLILTGCLGKVLLFLVRDYGTYISLNPISHLHSRFTIIPALTSILAWLWLSNKCHIGFSLHKLSLILIWFNLVNFNFFSVRERMDPRFATSWPAIAQSIENALLLKSEGKLSSDVIIQNIPCWPPDWHGNYNTLTIKASVER
jgi:hypothetical protein